MFKELLLSEEMLSCSCGFMLFCSGCLSVFNAEKYTVVQTLLKECNHMWPRPPLTVVSMIRSQCALNVSSVHLAASCECAAYCPSMMGSPKTLVNDRCKQRPFFFLPLRFFPVTHTQTSIFFVLIKTTTLWKFREVGKLSYEVMDKDG